MRTSAIVIAVCAACMGCRTKTGTITCWGYFEYDKNSTVYKEWNGPHYRFDQKNFEGVWEGTWSSMFKFEKKGVPTSSEEKSYVRLELFPNGQGRFAEVQRETNGTVNVGRYAIHWQMTEQGAVKGTYTFSEDHTYVLSLCRCRNYDVLAVTDSGLHGGPPSHALLRRVDPFADDARMRVMLGRLTENPVLIGRMGQHDDAPTPHSPSAQGTDGR